MPKESVDNPWETIEGLDDDFDFYIEAPYFGFMKEYMEGEQALLIWQGSSPDTDTSRVIWPIGKGWEVVDSGARVTHEKREKFIKSSMYGKLINRVTSDLRVDMGKRGKPTDAEVWKGLGFHLNREEIKYEGLLEDRGGKTIHLMPTAFLGEKGKPAVAVAKAKAAPSVSVGTPATAVASVASVSLLEKKLSVLAKANDLTTFQSKALDMPEVSANENLLAQVLNDGPDGYWAQHHQA